MNTFKWRLLAACTAMLLLTSAYQKINSAGVMTEAAKTYLASLAPEQQGAASLPFEGDERLFWHFVPDNNILDRYKRPRKGLTLGQMTPAQKHLASALLSAGLSQRGYIKASSIMSLEDILRMLEKDTVGRRDPDKYYFSVFGEPSENGVWGYRVEGHHLSLHFTIVKGKVTGSPMFLGANPAEVRQGPRKGLRVLAREEDLGRELMKALDAGQAKIALVSPTAYKDILTEASRKAVLQGQPGGLPAGRMNARQREMLQALLEEYVHNLPEQVAETRLEQIRKAGANLHFAWAGSVDKGTPHYYRVVAPAFLIEYDNSQNEGNHIHSVWRDLEGDFGLDLLKQHYETSHR